MCWDNTKARSKYQQTEKTETKNDQIKEKIPGQHRSEESVTIPCGTKCFAQNQKMISIYIID